MLTTRFGKLGAAAFAAAAGLILVVSSAGAHQANTSANGGLAPLTGVTASTEEAGADVDQDATEVENEAAAEQAEAAAEQAEEAQDQAGDTETEPADTENENETGD